MPVKAKFKCQWVTDTDYGQLKNRQVSFTAVSKEQGDNADYSKYTPYGELRMNISEGTTAHDFLSLEKEYCLTFDEVPET